MVNKRCLSVFGLVCALALVRVAAPIAAASDLRVADAAMHGDLAAVRALLAQGADVNGAEGDGMTALHWAAEQGDDKLAALLLEHRAQPAALTRIGQHTPLHVAAKGGHAGVVRALLDAK